MRLLLCLLLSLVLFVTNCSQEPNKPKDVITQDQYIDLLVELQLVRTFGENAETDSLTLDSLATVVFDKYDVTRESFQRSHRYYQQFPEQQKQRIETAIERLKMDKVGNGPDSKKNGD
jgi:hypothetical protein